MEWERSGVAFRTTSWTLVEAARSGDEGERSRALAALAERYWPAVYAAVRWMGHEREEAAEITQGFFADVVVGRELFSRAEAARGRLRALVLAALRNYVRERFRRARARGSLVTLHASSLEREEAMLAEWTGGSETDVFERRWAIALLEEALEACERRFVGTGREGHWRAFERRVLRPALAHTAPPPLKALAPELGFATAGDAAAAVQVVRKWLVSYLRTAGGGEDLDRCVRLLDGEPPAARVAERPG